jgi:hypothetical protein
MSGGSRELASATEGWESVLGVTGRDISCELADEEFE